MNYRIANKILKEMLRAFSEDFSPTNKYSTYQICKAYTINYKHLPIEVRTSILEMKKMDKKIKSND